MTILRMERLGDHSDIILCLFDGDAYRVDIHEAPEHLHYGIDSYAYSDGKVTAKKNLRSFYQNRRSGVHFSSACASRYRRLFPGRLHPVP